MSNSYAKSLAKSSEKYKAAPVCVPENCSVKGLVAEFMIWFESHEGGAFVPDIIPPDKQESQRKNNQKMGRLIETVLYETLGSEEFPACRLILLKEIGVAPSPNELSVLERLKEGKTYGTVKNYMAAVTHFLDWLVARGQHLISKTEVDNMRAALVGIIRTVESCESSDSDCDRVG